MARFAFVRREPLIAGELLRVLVFLFMLTVAVFAPQVFVRICAAVLAVALSALITVYTRSYALFVGWAAQVEAELLIIEGEPDPDHGPDLHGPAGPVSERP